MLIQGLNLFCPDGDELLHRFDFIPQARLDDLMVSYAVDGGGVGPHFDNYDVFLLQGIGQRRWLISDQDDRSLIEYPSAFPIKVMGAHVEGFEEAVVAVALAHDPGFDRATIERRPSKGGNYLGLTITVTATSREQLDSLYRALTGHPMVKVVL